MKKDEKSAPPPLNPAERLLHAIFGVGRPEGEQTQFTPEQRAALHEKLKEKIERVLQTLTFREREILKLRYGIGDGYVYTLEEVGRMFKVTRERVRQIEAKAVRKLQHPVRARKLESFLNETFGTEQSGTTPK